MTSAAVQPPVRLCCGKRHDGVMCGDGRIMCESCFDRVDLANLYVDEGGVRWNVCKECAPDVF